MHLIYWSEIEDARISTDLGLLTISHGGGSKAFISLSPIRKDQRTLLKRAIEGTMKGRKTKSDCQEWQRNQHKLNNVKQPNSSQQQTHPLVVSAVTVLRIYRELFF